jgi:hypothetical protein
MDIQFSTTETSHKHISICHLFYWVIRGTVLNNIWWDHIPPVTEWIEKKCLTTETLPDGKHMLYVADLNGAGSVILRNKKQNLKSLQFYIVTVSFSKFCVSGLAQFIFNQSTPCNTSAGLQHLMLPWQRTGALVPHCCSDLMIGVHGKQPVSVIFVSRTTHRRIVQVDRQTCANYYLLLLWCTCALQFHSSSIPQLSGYVSVVLVFVYRIPQLSSFKH